MFEFIYLSIQVGILLFLFHVARKRGKFLYWAAFLIPLQSISFEWQILFTWAKLMFPISIGILLFHPAYRSYKKPCFPGAYLLYLFFLYVFLLTFGYMIYDYTYSFGYEFAEAAGTGAAQSIFRYPVQLLHFFFAWGLLLTGIWFSKNTDDLTAALRGFIAGNIFNVFVGLYQVIADATSLPFFYGYWVFRDIRFNSPRVFVNLGPIEISRLSGLGGEPKYAGINFILALFFILCWQSFPQGIPPIKHWRRDALLLIFGIFMTFSVGAWLALILCFAYLLSAGILTRRSKIFSVLSFTILLLSILLFFVGETTLSNLAKTYINPKFNFQEGKGGLAMYMDTSLVYYFLENPYRLIVGSGAGGTAFAMENFWFFHSKFSAAPAFTIMRLVGDFGLVGILMIIALFMKWRRFLFEHRFTAYGHIVTGGFLLMLVGHIAGLYGILLITGAIIGATSHEILRTQPDHKSSNSSSRHRQQAKHEHRRRINWR